MSAPTSIPALLREAAIARPDQPFISWLNPSTPDAQPIDITFGDFEVMVRRAIRVLDEAGVGPGDRVLLFADNSPAWQAVAVATQTIRAEPAAVFASLGFSDVMDITCRVQPKAVFVGNAKQWAMLDKVLTSLHVTPLVMSPDETISIEDRYPRKSLREMEAVEPILESEFEMRAKSVEADDPFVLIFTSGTTGRQKGVRLPQRAAMEAMEAAIACTAAKERDTGLHILPFAHIAGLCAFYAALMSRGRLILCSRREDLLRGFSYGPTYTLLVPLIYERIRKETISAIEKKPGPLKRFLCNSLAAAMRIASDQSTSWRDRFSARIARRLIGGKIKKKLGGRIRFLGAGGALSEPELIAFFRGLGFNYLNFYGMSETCGVIALNCSKDENLRVASVGRPWSGVEIRIENDGEILVRGRTMMTSYLEREGNIGAFTEDGFFRTGDLGYRDEQGYLFVTGRKKNIFVLSTGKKFSPEPVELRIRGTLHVTDAVLVGDGKAFVSAGLFVLPEELKALEDQGGEKDLSSFFLKLVRQGLAGLSDYEIPKKVFIIPGAPYDYPTLMTPTLKIKRNVFVQTFSSQIREMYEGHRGH